MNYPTIVHDYPLKRPREQEIRLIAYYIYLRRGRGKGHALDDWLKAERYVPREGAGTTRGS